MDNHIEFQDDWEQGASEDLTLHDSNFKRDDKILQECAEWETHPEVQNNRSRTNEPDFEPEPIASYWNRETLLTCVQQKSGSPK